jgi:mannose-6-phosphate isomerase-like protein (cupin superfamily)
VTTAYATGLTRPGVATGARVRDRQGVTARVIRADEGEIFGSVRGCRDRFLIDSPDSDRRFAVVEHLLAPRSIAAPMHRHTKEDEFSFILEGRVWFIAAGEEVVADVGDLVFKPRGEWHTFWNADMAPARMLEMISPGGLEEAFRIIDTATDDVDLGALVEPYGFEADMDATDEIMEKYRLTFG